MLIQNVFSIKKITNSSVRLKIIEFSSSLIRGVPKDADNTESSGRPKEAKTQNKIANDG